MLLEDTKWNYIKYSTQLKRGKKDSCNEQKIVTNVGDINSTKTNSLNASIQRHRLSEQIKKKAQLINI